MSKPLSEMDLAAGKDYIKVTSNGDVEG